MLGIASGWREKVVGDCLCLGWLPGDLHLALCPLPISQAPFCPGSLKQSGKMSNGRSPAKTPSHSQSKCGDFHINRLPRQSTRLTRFVFRSFMKRYTLSVRLLSQLALRKEKKKRPPFLLSSLCACHLSLLLWKEACHTMKSFSTLAPLPASHFSLFKSVYTVSLATQGRSWYFFISLTSRFGFSRCLKVICLTQWVIPAVAFLFLSRLEKRVTFTPYFRPFFQKHLQDWLLNKNNSFWTIVMNT